VGDAVGDGQAVARDGADFEWYLWRPLSVAVAGDISVQSGAQRSLWPTRRSYHPPGPRVQENLGRKTPARTYTHLLASPQDEALFEYYITSALEQVTLTGQRSPLADPGLISEAIPSPDGQYSLLSWVQRPFSYQVPESRFPRLLQVLDAAGTVLYTVAELGLDDQRSIKFDAVRPGRRGVSWRSDRPATLYWVEALDGGDPQQAVPHRDRVMQQAAPFTEEPTELWRSQHRFQRLTWGRADVALAWERASCGCGGFIPMLQKLRRPCCWNAAPRITTAHRGRR
jgi:hypothetical protein